MNMIAAAPRSGPVTWLAILMFAGAMFASGAIAALFGTTPDWPALKRSIRERHPTVPQLSTAELNAWLADRTRVPPLLIDARAPQEYAVSHLRDAKRAATIEAARALLAGQPKDVVIVVYCSVGVRSAALAERLMRDGYRNVSNLEGSLFEWANRGHPVYRGSERADRVHPYDRNWGQLLERRLWADAGT